MGVPFLTAESLSAPRLSHGFFGREGGVSTGVYDSLNAGYGSDDSPDNVRENRRLIAATLGTSEPQLQSLSQVHSRDVIIIDSATSEPLTADGLVTTTPGLAISALGADCAPVLFADVAAGVIGACHAGWRGALSGITEATIEAMESVGAVRGHICAAIGPCIHPDSYQVGAEFRETFTTARSGHAEFFVQGPTRDDGTDSFQFDLPGFLHSRLRAANIARIDPSPVCTYAHPGRYFSYRYNTHYGVSDYGRNISAIMLR